MVVKFSFSSLRRIRWHEYALRFAFGGAATVITGLIASKFGASIGGLFLAFPAIMPAAVTLVEKKEIEKKHQAGLHGTRRGKEVAGVDAVGTSMGTFGLLVFSIVAWQLFPRYPAWLVLISATVAWFTVAVTVWWVKKRG